MYSGLKRDLKKLGLKIYKNKKTKSCYVKKSEVTAALKVVAESPFVGEDENDEWDDEALKQVLKFMKGSGLVPTGTGKPTKPSKAVPHDVAYDPELDVHYLITDTGYGGSVWIITPKGEADFVASYRGDFKPMPGVKIYKAGQYQDYLSIEAIRAILDIVDPEWKQPSSADEQEYIEELERLEKLQ